MRERGGLDEPRVEGRDARQRAVQLVQMVLEPLARGLRNSEIAAETGLSLPTVKSHVQATYRKLDVHAAPDAVLRARELGLL